METPTSDTHEEPSKVSSSKQISVGKKTLIGGSGALLGAIVGGPIGAVVGGAIGATVGAVAEHNPSGKTAHAVDTSVASVRKAAGSTEAATKKAVSRTVAVAKGATAGAKREMKSSK